MKHDELLLRKWDARVQTQGNGIPSLIDQIVVTCLLPPCSFFHMFNGLRPTNEPVVPRRMPPLDAPVAAPTNTAPLPPGAPTFYGDVPRPAPGMGPTHPFQPAPSGEYLGPRHPFFAPPAPVNPGRFLPRFPGDRAPTQPFPGEPNNDVLRPPENDLMLPTPPRFDYGVFRR